MESVKESKPYVRKSRSTKSVKTEVAPVVVEVAKTVKRAPRRLNKKLAGDMLVKVKLAGVGVRTAKCVGTIGSLYGKFIVKLDGRSWERNGKVLAVRRIHMRDVIV